MVERVLSLCVRVCLGEYRGPTSAHHWFCDISPYDRKFISFKSLYCFCVDVCKQSPVNKNQTGGQSPLGPCVTVFDW